jgi:hypothetical protein
MKLIDAIETASDIASLTERLCGVEAEIKRIQYTIDNHRPLKLDDALNGLRELTPRVQGSAPERAKGHRHGPSENGSCKVLRETGFDPSHAGRAPGLQGNGQRNCPT